MLGTMMIRAGLLSEDQIARASAHCDGGESLVDAVVTLGLTDEDQLVDFFHRRMTIPKLAAALLEQVATPPIERMPANVAWHHMMLPVSADDAGNLTVVMADPTDVDAVEAATRCSGAYIVRAVASASAIRAALERHYGPRPTLRHNGHAGAANGHDPSANAVAQQHVPAGAPATPMATDPLPKRARTESGPIVIGPPEPLSAEAFGQLIPHVVGATSRDEITRVLLDFLGDGFSRVLLFVHSRDELRGRDARGEDLDLEAVKQVRIPAHGPSIFSTVLQKRAPYFGPLRQDTPINAAFSKAFGGLSGNVLVLPVVLSNKVPLLVFASGTSHAVHPRSIQALAESVSEALQRLIFRQKAQP